MPQQQPAALADIVHAHAPATGVIVLQGAPTLREGVVRG